MEVLELESLQKLFGYTHNIHKHQRRWQKHIYNLYYLYIQLIFIFKKQTAHAGNCHNCTHSLLSRLSFCALIHWLVRLEAFAKRESWHQSGVEVATAGTFQSVLCKVVSRGTVLTPPPVAGRTACWICWGSWVPAAKMAQDKNSYDKTWSMLLRSIYR